MDNFLVLGQIPGTNIHINFYIWCSLLIAILFFLYSYFRRPAFKANMDLIISKAYIKLEPITRHELIGDVARDERFAIKSQVFKQNLTLSIGSFCRKIANRPKINS